MGTWRSGCERPATTWSVTTTDATVDELAGLLSAGDLVIDGDSGEGRWTVEEAIANAVPVPAISAALYARFASRQADSPAMKAIATLRNQFGGHAVTST